MTIDDRIVGWTVLLDLSKSTSPETKGIKTEKQISYGDSGVPHIIVPAGHVGSIFVHADCPCKRESLFPFMLCAWALLTGDTLVLWVFSSITVRVMG